MSINNPRSYYTRELSSFLGKRVVVDTISTTPDQKPKTYTGKMTAIVPEGGSGFVVLKDVIVKEGDQQVNKFHKIFINGNLVSTIVVEDVPFDLPKLAMELEKTFRRPGDVKLYEDSGLIVVLERVKVTEKGVEGTGPVADRVDAIYNRFIKEFEEAVEQAELAEDE